MKKLEFAKVQEGENKLAIEVSNDSPVVAVISQNGMLECILVNDSFPEVFLIFVATSLLNWELLL